MTVLEVHFPDSWTIVPGGPHGLEAVTALVAGLDEHRSGGSRGRQLPGLLPLLTDVPLESFACLLAPDVVPGPTMRACCAIGVMSTGAAAGDADLREVAESGPHRGLDRQTRTVILPLGRAVRSSAVRFAEELLAVPEVAPYVAEVRFALPLPAGRIGVLHFETMELDRLAEMTGLFDEVARTARLA